MPKTLDEWIAHLTEIRKVMDGETPVDFALFDNNCSFSLVYQDNYSAHKVVQLQFTKEQSHQ